MNVLASEEDGAKAGELQEGVASEVPLRQLETTKPAGLGLQLRGLGAYLVRTEVHTYAFSVAANTILALFPFIVMLLTVSRAVFGTSRIEPVVGEVMKSFLPTGQSFVMRNMQVLAHPRSGIKVFSVLMLLLSSSGVFLPLEVALNQVWGVRENRSYIRNQVVSIGLALLVGVLGLLSVLLSAGQKPILTFLLLGHTDGMAFGVMSRLFVRALAVCVSVLLFFLVYWILPNRPVPAVAVLPAACVTGLLWEGAKALYIRVLPWLDLQSVYGPFYISVGLMMWAFLSGLLLLAGAHLSATRYTVRLAREAREGDAAGALGEAER